MNIKLISTITTPAELEQIKKISAEIADTMQKRQIFRTDTEARISVLNDAAFPTRASKYWQAVREQSVMFEQLALMDFEMRRKVIQLKKLKRAWSEANDPLDIESIYIDIQECEFALENVRQVASDRVREILMWSQIKNELDDGSFDTTNVNSHQAQSLKQQLEQRFKTLNPYSNPSEILNVVGPLQTANQLESNGKVLPFGKVNHGFEG